MASPVDNLVRAWARPEAASIRADNGAADGRTMVGHFAVFDRWTTIDSWYEGRFRERVGEGAFKQTMKDRSGQIRILYDHGHDPQIGNKPLGAPDVLREDSMGAYYESQLFDTSYVNDLLPALRAGQMGASFRFRITGEEWVEPAKPTDVNPEMLPERTITGVELYEFGPVTFPAYSDATAGLRSRSDEFIDWMFNDPTFVARLTERAGLSVVERILATVPADGRTDGKAQQEPATADGQTEGNDPRRDWFNSRTFV